jgi:hypothetical protein
MSSTAEQRIAELEAKVQALAEDYSNQVYGHSGPVEWQEEEGWLLIVPNGAGQLPEKHSNAR